MHLTTKRIKNESRQLMKNFTIPQHCNENFAEMTPTERGAFCNKCATDTFDFRTKKTEEIKQLFGAAASDEVIHRDNLVIL